MSSPLQAVPDPPSPRRAARKPRTVRMTDDGYSHVQSLAKECDRSDSEAMIALMSEALRDPAVMRKVRTRLGKAAP